VTLDFPGATLYLKQGARFDRRDQPDRSGFDFARLDGSTVIECVEKDSPAARAGLEPKDVLLSVAGVPVDPGSLFPIRQLLRHEGPTIAVKFKRGPEEREVSLPLGGWPSPLTASEIEAALKGQ
jgi:S1-C subfamily serine protease